MKTILQEPPGSETCPPANPTPRLVMNSTKTKDAMKLVRRTHLYAGLFLAPWVAMYGVSGLIFNHGSWFAPASDAASKPIEWTVDGAALPSWPEPEALARQVVAGMNAAAKAKDKATGMEYQLSAAASPQLQGGVFLEGQDEAGGSVSLSFDRVEGKGTTSHSPPRPPVEQVQLATNDAVLLNATKDALLAAAGRVDSKLSATKWSGDGDFPRLAFRLEHGQQRRVADYDLRSGRVSLQSEPTPMRVPDFLTSLHMSRGYPSEKKSAVMKTVHAAFVDAMAFLMCFWAISGIAMWLQMKHLRRPGLPVAIASVLAAVFVWSAMYRLLAGN